MAGHVTIGVFDPAKKQLPVGKNVNEDLELWLYIDNLSSALPQQHVRVVVKRNDGHVISDKEYVVGGAKPGDPITTKGISLPKGSNVATLLPSSGGPCDQLVGFYVG